MADTVASLVPRRARRIVSPGLTRLITLTVVILYCGIFHWSYIAWISPAWSYDGYVYKTHDPRLVILGYVLAAALAAFSPNNIQRVSHVIYWILMYIVYIPSLFVPVFVQFDKSSTILWLQLCMTGGMLFLLLSYKIPLLSLPRYQLKQRSFWILFGIVYVFLNIVILAAFHGHIHLASVKEVYVQRVSGGEVVSSTFGIGYTLTTLSNIMSPFLIAYGLSTGRRKLVALGIVGQIIIYATGAMKSILVSPIFIAVFYYSLKRDRGGWVWKTGLALAGLSFIIMELAVSRGPESIYYIMASIWLMRTIAVSGINTAEYQYFFERHPHTYLAHVKGVDWLIHNPYNMTIGQIIGAYYGEIGGNSNAHFFVMDGITAFGLVGIPIMGLLCGVIFWILDSCTQRHKLSFCASALTVCVISLTNSSLFSTLLGGGLLAWLLLFVVMPQVE